MRITLLERIRSGGHRTAFVVETQRANVLVDCGFFQGPENEF